MTLELVAEAAGEGLVRGPGGKALLLQHGQDALALVLDQVQTLLRALHRILRVERKRQALPR